MRFHIFFSGAAVLALGMAAMRMLEKDAAIGYLQGALTLGGGFIICGLFSLKMKWHGIIGGGVLALLGSARGLANFPDLARLLTGEGERGATPVLEFGVTVICLVLLLKTLAELYRERVRRMLEGE